MRKPVIVMFSGQGSHYYQMGKELMGADPVFTRAMEEGDSLLAALGRPGFIEELYGSPASTPWRDLRSSHPGLVIIQYAVFQVLQAIGIQPDAVLASSVGAFPAAAASGILSFRDAVEAAFHQAEAIVRHCRPGGILAVLASPAIYAGSPRLQELVSLAGVNFAEHFVLAGFTEELREAALVLAELGVGFQELAVDYPFHHPGIDRAREPFLVAFQRQVRALAPPSIPWLLADGSTRREPTREVRPEFYWDTVAESMDFQRVVRGIEARGAACFIDAGPSGTLANFVRYGLAPGSRSEVWPVLTMFHQGQQKLRALQDARRTADRPGDP
jgi:acyl transferase domain-containing protein